MANELQPQIDQWYTHRDKGEAFRVVAVDARAGTIETQDFDGDVEELDFEAWRDMDIELAEPPEDWTGPFDEIEPDDLGYTETAMTPQDWRASLESLPQPEERWQDARAEEDLEEEQEGRPIETYAAEEDKARDVAQ